MDRVCAACGEVITEEQQWFRVREEYVHLSCSEKYMRFAAERKKAGAAPAKPGPDAEER